MSWASSQGVLRATSRTRLPAHLFPLLMCAAVHVFAVLIYLLNGLVEAVLTCHRTLAQVQPFAFRKCERAVDFGAVSYMATLAGALARAPLGLCSSASTSSHT